MKRSMARVLIGLVAAAGTSAAVMAQGLEMIGSDVTDGITADLISRELRAKGFPADIDTDDSGDPRVTTRIDGRQVQVYFYTCTKGQLADRVCNSFQFFTRFQTSKTISLTAINDWNTKERYAKVYSYKPKSGPTVTHLEVDVHVKGTGAPPAQLFGTYLDIMQDRIERFQNTTAR